MHYELEAAAFPLKVRRFARQYRDRGPILMALANDQDVCPLCLLSDVADFPNDAYKVARFREFFEFLGITITNFIVEHGLNNKPELKAGGWDEGLRVSLVDQLFEICYNSKGYRTRMSTETIVGMCRDAIEAKNDELTAAAKSSSTFVSGAPGHTVH